MKVLVIIPAYNEGKNIEKTVKKIEKIKPKNNDQIDYIIINDGSLDNTLEVCKKNNYNVISLINNLGIGGAVQTGYKYAYYNNYDVAIQFDGDGQHDEKYLYKLIEQINEGNDLVIGSRFISDLSKFKSTYSRQVGIKILSSFIKFFTGKKIYDPTSGFRAINKKIIKYFCFNYPIEYPEPYSNAEIIKLGYKIAEIPVEMHEREHGVSSISLSKSFYYMISVCTSIALLGLKRRRK